MSEAQLAERIAKQPKPLEDSVALVADMQAGLATLSDTQRRRILLYHEHGLTYEQIAKAEKRSVATIAESIKAAEEKLKLFWEEP